eukprot:353340-Chlamydomonas_euryale.AAC.1
MCPTRTPDISKAVCACAEIGKGGCGCRDGSGQLTLRHPCCPDVLIPRSFCSPQHSPQCSPPLALRHASSPSVPPPTFAAPMSPTANLTHRYRPKMWRAHAEACLPCLRAVDAVDQQCLQLRRPPFPHSPSPAHGQTVHAAERIPCLWAVDAVHQQCLQLRRLAAAERARAERARQAHRRFSDRCAQPGRLDRERAEKALRDVGARGQ